MPTLLPVHPTPLYDSLFHLLFFAVLFRLAKTGKAGQAGWLFFVATAVFNMALEFIRINPAVGFGLTLSQWTYVAILIASMGFATGFFRKKIHF